MESVTTMVSHNNSASEDSNVYSEESETTFSSSPSKKIWSQKIQHPLAWRMHRLYETNKRCLVENTVDENALSYVHCLPRHLEPRRVNALEFAWGMQRGTLNLNTRLNVFCLSPNFKELWETFKWFLLPEDHIIHHFHDAALNDRGFPDVGEGPYKYRFIAHPAMKAVAIHRQTVFPDNKTSDLKPEHFMFCSYPFENIGALSCHLHPKFIICHIGWMAAKADDIFLSDYANAHPHLLELITIILQICNKWTCPLDKTDPKYLSFLRNTIDPSDIISETYTRTGNGRIKPHISRKRRVSGKHKRTGSAANLISTNKLRMLREQLIPGQVSSDILLSKSNISNTIDNQAQIDGLIYNNDRSMVKAEVGIDIEIVDA